MEAEIQSLLQWADTKGIILNGITPKKLHGRGMGLVATDDIKVKNLTTHPHKPHFQLH